MKAVMTTTLALPISAFVTSTGLEELKTSLTLVQKQLSPLSKPSVLRAYSVQDKHIHIPKAFGLARAAALGITEIVDQQFMIGGHDAVAAAAAAQSPSPPIQLPKGLRVHQQEATEKILAAFHSSELGGGAFLVMPCGFGKTVTALNICAVLGVKCMILTHTAVLATQWEAAIAQYVPTATVGHVKQKKFEVTGKTHIIASLQSVAKRDYDWPSAGIGLVIIDEAHHIAALTLSQALVKAGTKYRLGLSATPQRSDGLSVYLHMAIGPIVYQIERERSEELRVYGIMLEDGPVVTKTLRGGTVNMAAMVNCMLDNSSVRAHERQQLACTWIRLCASKGRQIIVIADRIELLKDLGRRLEGHLTTQLLIGETKPAERALAKNAQVVLGSYGLCAEGLDVPSLDTMLFLTPRSGKPVITQCVGRLLRTGGRTPLVIDFVDKNGVFQGMWRKRLAFYSKMGAVVTKYDEYRNEL